MERGDFLVIGLKAARLGGKKLIENGQEYLSIIVKAHENGNPGEGTGIGGSPRRKHKKAKENC